MRVFTTLVALVAVPLVAGIAQSTGDCVQQGQHDGADAGCSLPPPTGTAFIQGTVFLDANLSGKALGQAGLAGWTVNLTGTVTTSTATDAAGGYSFMNLPGGNYTVCEVVMPNYHETTPTAAMGGVSCPDGSLGFMYAIPDGFGFVLDFGNLTP